MKYAITFAIVALATIVYALPKPDDEKYTTKYDNVDVDSILSNERLLKNYIDCIEGKGKCTAEGEELKQHMKDAIQNCCDKCSEKQKEGVKKVFKHFEEKKPEVLNKLKAEHDPNGEFEKVCREKVKDIDI
uniref:Chemosensory protein 5 n=1 Tax=Chrysopa pallens TaxID=417485 RepID=A0A0R8P0H5_CHRPA|nr:chemosensory protein 5 [Chrysopa pallens]